MTVGRWVWEGKGGNCGHIHMNLREPLTTYDVFKQILYDFVIKDSMNEPWHFNFCVWHIAILLFGSVAVVLLPLLSVLVWTKLNCQWCEQRCNKLQHIAAPKLVTFHVRHSRSKMCISHSGLCVWLSLAAFPYYCTDPDVTWGNGTGCPLIVQYWADLQSVHGFCCYDNVHVFELIALFTANECSAKREMSASACTRSMPGSVQLSCRTLCITEPKWTS